MHAISGGGVWGGRGGWGSPFFMVKVNRLPLACPLGVFYQGSGLRLNKVETKK